LPGDTTRELAARLGPREHELLRATVELFTARRVELRADAVVLDGQRLTQPLLLNEKNHFD
jgi:phosphoribosylglycinamide formyltransferase-1